MALGTYPISLEEWPADLDAMAERMTRTDVVAAVAPQLAEKFYRGVHGAFMSGTAPDGSPWGPHAPSTIRRYGPHPLLILTGVLVASASSEQGPGSSMEVSGNSITFGVSVPTEGEHDIAAIQHYGAPRANIPARPFFFAGDTTLDEMEELIADYFESEVL